MTSHYCSLSVIVLVQILLYDFTIVTGYIYLGLQFNNKIIHQKKK